MLFEHVPHLNAEALKALEPIFWGHDYAKEINAKISELWAVNGGALWIITRLEKTELVVCCACGVGFVHAFYYILKAAKLQGIESIRFHTRAKKRAVEKLISLHYPDFFLVDESGKELIYRIKTNGR